MDRQETIHDPDEAPPIEWLAGFFEGEGCVSAYTTNVELSCGVNQTQVRLQVKTTEPSEPKAFQDTFGGRIDVELHEPPASHCHRWLAYGSEALIALERLMPHVRGPKKDQMVLAMEYLRIDSPHVVEKETAERRLELVREIQNLTQ